MQHPPLAQDCCPRNPFEKYEIRFAGEVDANLTRVVCDEETITITQESVCLSQFNQDLNVAPGFGDSKEYTTFVVTAMLLVLCLGVILFMVPFVVYSQLVYSGRWPIFTWTERLLCMLTGDFTRTAEMEEEKNVAHKQNVRLLSVSFLELKDFLKKKGVAASELKYALDKQALIAIAKKEVKRKHIRLDSSDLVVAIAAAPATSEPELACNVSATLAKNGSWCHLTQTKALSRDTFDRFEQHVVQSSSWRILECIKCLIKWIVRLISLATNVARLEVVFDILPLRCDTRFMRKCVKIVRVLLTTFVIGMLLVHTPETSAAALRNVIACVMASCQHSHWREEAQPSELECEAAGAVGLIQPSFWSDVVDIVQASLSLAVLTLLGEWKETVEGKNLVGASLLEKVDVAGKQEKHSKTNLPKGKPKRTFSAHTSRKAEVSHTLDREETMKLLDSLRKDPELKPNKKQKEMIAAVNIGSSAAKLTMAQLFAAIGSIIAIVAGARRYDSNCFLNVAMFDNTTSVMALADNTTSSAGLMGRVSAVGSYYLTNSGGGIFDRNDERLEVILLKPSKAFWVTWAVIFRATLGNLTLLTIGIALKNFITRTAASKAHADSMLREADPSHEKKTDVFTVLTNSFKFGKQIIDALLYSLLYYTVLRIPCCTLQCCKPAVEDAVLDTEDLLEKQPGLDEATKQNVRSIMRVYKISSIAICIIVYWYTFVVVASVCGCLFSLIQVVTLNGAAFFTLVPLLTFIAKPLKRGADSSDGQKIDACVYVVQGIIFLRSCLVASHSLMMRNIYDYWKADLVTWESYWSNGDASEKLAYMLSFNVHEIFNFSLDMVPKILSFVVIGIELVVLIGSNIRKTAIVRLFCRCCQPRCNDFAKWAAKIGVVAEKIKDVDIDLLEMAENAFADNPRELLDAGKFEMKRQAENKLTKVLGPYLPKDAREEALQHLSEAVGAVIDAIESLEDVVKVASECLNDMEQFLQEHGTQIAEQSLLAIAKAWLARKIASRLGDDNDTSSSKVKKELGPIMETFNSREDVWKAARDLEADPVNYISNLKSKLSGATSSTDAVSLTELQSPPNRGRLVLSRTRTAVTEYSSTSSPPSTQTVEAFNEVELVEGALGPLPAGLPAGENETLGACGTKLTKAVHVGGKHVSSRIERLTTSRAVMDDETLASSVVLDAARTDGGVLLAREQAETKISLDVIQTRISAVQIKRAQPLPLIPDTLGRSISSIRPLTICFQSASQQGASTTQTRAMSESEAVCHRVCIQWWNHRLSQRGLCVCDLPSDVRSGELVHSLVELITGAVPGTNQAHSQTTMSGAWYQSNTRSKSVDPASPRGRLLSAMYLLRSSGIPISTRSGKRATAGGPHGTTMRLEGMDEYVEMATALEFGSWPAIKSLTWSLILHTDVWVGLQSSAEALADLLQWVRDAVKGYEGVIVGHTRHAWSTSFSSGLVWCALVHTHDEDLLNYKEMLLAEPEVRLRTVVRDVTLSG